MISSAPVDELSRLIPRVLAIEKGKVAISFEEFCYFHMTLQRHFKDIVEALVLYHTNTSARIGVESFVKAAKVVCNVELPRHLVRVLLLVFSASSTYSRPKSCLERL